MQVFLTLAARFQDSKQKTNRKENLRNVWMFAERRGRLSHKANFRCKCPRRSVLAALVGCPRAAVELPSYIAQSGGWGELGIIGKRVSKRGGGGLKNEEVPAVLESEFPEKIRDVVLCRAFCNVQLARNVLVCEVPKKKLEHLTFACR